jgi:hypothetical protein
MGTGRLKLGFQEPQVSDHCALVLSMSFDHGSSAAHNSCSSFRRRPESILDTEREVIRRVEHLATCGMDSGLRPLLSGEIRSCEEPRLKTIQLVAVTPSSVAYFAFGIRTLE